MGKLNTVYDFTGQPADTSFLIMVIFVIAGLIVFIYHFSLSKEHDGLHGPFKPIFPGADYKGINTKFKGIIFGLLITLAGCILTVVMYTSSHSPLYNFYKKLCAEKTYLSVQGKVTQFHHSQNPYHDTERFYVNGVKFEISDTGYGYHANQLAEDPLRSGLTVRISYINVGEGNVILKLETE